MDAMAGSPLLEVRDLSVFYGKVEAVHRMSLAADEGRIVTVIGPNGAGKTSLQRAISGLVPHRGEIRIGGVSTRELRRRDVAQRVSVVPQSPFLPPGMTVQEYVLLGRTPYVSYLGREGRSDQAAAAAAIARLDLVDFAGRELGTLPCST